MLIVVDCGQQIPTPTYPKESLNILKITSWSGSWFTTKLSLIHDFQKASHEGPKASIRLDLKAEIKIKSFGFLKVTARNIHWTGANFKKISLDARCRKYIRGTILSFHIKVIKTSKFKRINIHAAKVQRTLVINGVYDRQWNIRNVLPLRIHRMRVMIVF